MIKFELLDKSHDRKRFDCENTQLNIFLQKAARQHITKGMSRTFVLINDENSKELLGFYTLSICEVETDYLPPIIAKKYPDQVPALRLARLSVSKGYQHKGYGNYLIGVLLKKSFLFQKTLA